MQPNVATLLRHYFKWLQHCCNITSNGCNIIASLQPNVATLLRHYFKWLQHYCIIATNDATLLRHYFKWLQHYCMIATQCCNIVATFLQMVATLLHHCNPMLQHCCDITSNGCNIIASLQRCVTLKIAVANRLCNIIFMPGLALRAGGRGFPLAIMNVTPGYFYGKINDELEPKEIASCLIPRLLVVVTRQLEILVTSLPLCPASSQVTCK